MRSGCRRLKAYRADIDGMRAVAVISVILFHIDENILPGGFVGVDIFFVISGYLITMHILCDLELDKFSLLEFYRRRVRRIAPMMLFIVAVVITVSLMIQRPEDTRRVAATSVASLLSLANVYFWLFEDAGYFAQASNANPLLHLWSLGVEEQFYIFWPLILISAYKTLVGKRFLVVFLAVALVSFLLGQYLYPKSPSFVYYMLPTRAGELLVGAVAAYLVFRNPDVFVHRLVLHTSAVLGIVLVVSSLLLLSEDVVFPGLNAILPATGAALLILSGHYGNGGIKRILTIRPLVFIGLISYSAYLWHWPLLVFARYAGIDIGLVEGGVALVVTMLLSAISYYLIENPARRYKGDAWQVIAYQYAIPAGGLVAISVVIIVTGGYFLHRNADEYRSISSKALPAYEYDYVCQRWEISDEEIKDRSCVVGGVEGGGNPSVLLWGDSQAAHYIGVLGAFAERAGFAFRNLAHASCPPLLSDPGDFVPPKRVEKCRKSLMRVAKALAEYDVVIISSAWLSYDSRSNKFLDVFFDTVDDLVDEGKFVVLLGAVPHFTGYDRICNEKAIGIPYLECDRLDKVALSERVVRINSRLKGFASKNLRVEYFDLVDYLCNDGSCSGYNENGDPLYFDSMHLSMPGSWSIGRDIVDELSDVPYPFTRSEFK